MTISMLEIMFSDKFATVKNGNVTVELRDDSDVAEKVKLYLDKTIVKNDEYVEEIRIHLLSYCNPPKLPVGIQCRNWILKCESHTPYTSDLLESIPLNCEKLHVDVDNGGLGEQASCEQVKSAVDLSLQAPGNGGSGTPEVSNIQLLDPKAEKLFLTSQAIDESGVNALLQKITKSSCVNPCSARIEFRPITEDPSSSLMGMECVRKDDEYIVEGEYNTLRIKFYDNVIEVFY